jgi:hypothetical protein
VGAIINIATISSDSRWRWKHAEPQIHSCLGAQHPTVWFFNPEGSKATRYCFHLHPLLDHTVVLLFLLFVLRHRPPQEDWKSGSMGNLNCLSSVCVCRLLVQVQENIMSTVTYYVVRRNMCNGQGSPFISHVYGTPKIYTWMNKWGQTILTNQNFPTITYVQHVLF